MDNPLEQTVFADLAHIEKTRTDDLSGERTRAMLSYFDTVAQSSETHLQTALPDAERQLTSQLIEALVGCLEEVPEAAGVIAATPVTDTIKQAADRRSYAEQDARSPMGLIHLRSLQKRAGN